VKTKDGEATLGHSARYLVERKKREAMKRQAAEKRKAEEAAGQAAKRARLQEGEENRAKEVGSTLLKSLEVLDNQLLQATKKTYEALYGDRAELVMRQRIREMEKSQEDNAVLIGKIEARKKEQANGEIKIRGLTGGLIDG
jgi:hypothetical protein